MTASLGDGGVLGEGSAGGWGESAPAEESELLPNGGEFDLGEGHVLKLSYEGWRALLHRPEAVQAITDRAVGICDTANSLVAMDPRTVERLGKGEPPYKVLVQNQTGTKRARARVLPANMLGAQDHKHNLTLDKAVMSTPSDPIGLVLSAPGDSANEIVFDDEEAEEE